MPEKSSQVGNHFLTLGRIAEQLGVAIHRVKYAIEQHHVEPRMRVGITRVWAEEDLPRIQLALNRVAANKRRGR